MFQRKKRDKSKRKKRFGTQQQKLNLQKRPLIEVLELRRLLTAETTTYDTGFTQSAPLEIEIGGVTAGTLHDLIAVTGSAALNNRIDVKLIDSFEPAVGQTFDFLTATTAITGNFSNATGLYGFGDGSLYFDIVASTNSLQLVVKELAGASSITPETPEIQNLFGEFYSSYFTPTMPTTAITGDFELGGIAHVHGSFSFGTPANATVDVAQLGSSTTTQETVKTLTVAATDASLFFGTWDDANSNGILDAAEKNTGAMGFSLTNVDFGLAVMAPTTHNGNLFYSMKANAGATEFVEPSGQDLITLGAHSVSVELNNGFITGGVVDIPAAVNFQTSFATPPSGTNGSLPITIRTDTDPTTPDTIALNAPGLKAQLVANKTVLSMSEFAHLTGDFVFDYSVNNATVNTGLPTGAITLIPESIRTGLTTAIGGATGTTITSNFETISNLQMHTFAVAGTNISIFAGVKGPYKKDLDGDGTFETTNADATGLAISNVNLGLAMMVPVNPAIAKQLPSFYSVKGRTSTPLANQVQLVGTDDYLKVSARDISVDFSDGSPWPMDLGTATVDWATSFPADTATSTPAGFKLPTTPPTYIDYEGGTMKASMGYGEVQVSEFMYVSGALAFEQGSTEPITVKTGIAPNLLSAIPTDNAAINTAITEIGFNRTDGSFQLPMSTVTLGGSSLNAFVGVGGAYKSDTNGDGTITTNANSKGLVVSGLDFGVAMFEPGLGTLDDIGTIVPPVGTAIAAKRPTFVALKASADVVALHGITGMDSTAKGVKLEVNTAFGTPLVPGIWTPHIDFATSFPISATNTTLGFQVPTGNPLKPAHLDFNSVLLKASVQQAVVDVFGLVQLSGGFELVAGPSETVTLTDVAETTQEVQVVTFGAANVYAFAGINGPKDTDLDGDIDADDTPSPTALGVAVQNFKFGMALMGTAASPAGFLALKGSAANIGTVGLGDFNLGTGPFDFGFNVGLGATTGTAAIDFKKSYESAAGLNDGVYAVPTGVPGTTVDLDFSEATEISAKFGGGISMPGISMAGQFILGRSERLDLQEDEEAPMIVTATGTLSVNPGVEIVSVAAAGIFQFVPGGIAGKVTATAAAGAGALSALDVPGLAFDASVDFDLLVNTTGKEVDILIPKATETTTVATFGKAGVSDYSVANGVILDDGLTRLKSSPDDTASPTTLYYHLTVPKSSTTPPPVPGLPANATGGAPYIIVHAEGAMNLPGATLTGEFDLEATTNKAVMTASGNLSVGAGTFTLMQLDAVGAFQIDSEGIAGMIDLDLKTNPTAAQLASLAGFELTAEMNLLVNTTGKVKKISIPHRFNTLSAFDVTAAHTTTLAVTGTNTASVKLDDNRTWLASHYDAAASRVEYDLLIPNTPYEQTIAPTANSTTGGFSYLTVHAEGRLAMPGASLVGSFDLYSESDHTVIAVGAVLTVGVGDLVVMERTAGGALQVDGDGISGKLRLAKTASQGNLLPGDLFTTEQELNFLVNTTGKVKEIELPLGFDAKTIFGTNATDNAILDAINANSTNPAVANRKLSDEITWLRSQWDTNQDAREYVLVVPHQVVKSTDVPVPAATATDDSFILVRARGGVSLPGMSLTGDFNFLVDPARAIVTADVQASIGAAGTTVASLTAGGVLQINSAGIAGKLSASASTGSTPLSGLFAADIAMDLLINTTSTNVMVDLPFIFDPLTAFAVSTTEQATLTSTGTLAMKDQLTTLQKTTVNSQPKYSLLIPDSVTPTADAASYALFRAIGSADFPAVSANGRFDVALVDSNLEMVIDASATIPVLGQVNLDGKFTLNSSGLYGNVQATLASGSVSAAGFSLTGNFQFLVNTTSTAKLVDQFNINSQTGTVSSQTSQKSLAPQTVEILVGGRLSLTDSFVIAGKFEIIIDGTGLGLTLDARVKVFNQQLAIAGSGKIFSDGNIAFNVAATAPHFTVGTSSATLFDIRAGTAQFQVNTSGSTQLGVSPNTALVSIANANINALGFSASGGISVGINNGYFEIVVPSSNAITLNLFIVDISVHGFFRSSIDSPTDTTFSITGSASMGVGSSSFGANGTISVTVASSGFQASFSGNARLFGFDFASVSGNVSLNGQSLSMSITVSVGIPGYCVGSSWWRVCTPSITIDKTASFHIGTTSAPAAPPPPPPVVATLLANGVLRLNMGDLASVRGDSLTNENYEVRHISGTSGNEIVEVTGVGYTQQYSGVAKIYAPDAGSGDDFLAVQNGVLAIIEFHGGAGRDQFMHAGSGSATATGGAGRDNLIGGSSNDNLDGGDDDDQISGGGGNDTIAGGGGNDTLTGDDGDDVITAGTGDDVIDGAAGRDTLSGNGGADRIQGGGGNDTINGHGGNDSLFGGTGIDTIHGNVGADIILGGADGDFLYGDEDNDVVIGDGGNDVIDGNGGNDTLLGDSGQLSGLVYVSTTTTDAGIDTIHGNTGNDTILGGAGADNLYGDENNDTISGETGDDKIWGGAGADVLNGNENADIIRGEAGVDTIHGNAGADTIYGGADGDFLYGDEDNDVIMGDGGNDTIDGNAGNDRLLGDSGQLSGLVYVSTTTTDAGIDTIHGNTGNDTILGGAGADNLYGDENNDTISGETGDDKIWGGADADVLNGNENADIIRGEAGVDTIHGNAGADTIYGGADGDFLYGDEDNDVIMGDGGNDTIDGNAGNDRLLGDSGQLSGLVYVSTTTTDAGNDTVHGNTGDDTILGGAGDDLLHGDADSDTISGETGDDTIYGGAANDFLYGNEDNDVIMGDGGNDTIDGNAGNDRLLGDSGQLSGLVYVSTTTTDAGIDTIHGNTGNDTILGGAGADNLYGDENNDTISGETGDDKIWGGADADVLNGNENADIIRGEAGVDTIHGNAGADTIYGGADGDFLYGDEDNDVIMGDGGNDTIDGNAGNDRLLGDSGQLSGLVYVSTTTTDAGNDTVHGNTGDDTILGGAGDDLLHGDADSDTISGETGDDTIYGGAANDFLYGNEDNDVIMGDGGNDTIDGNAGNDTLLGDSGELNGTNYVSTSTTDAGNDTIHGNTGEDKILGGAGADSLHGDEETDAISGEAGDDTIYGGAGNDFLDGNDDNDVIMGDGGNDTINGNAGNDTLLGDSGELNGTNYVSTVTPDAGNDTVHGNTGDDTILGGAGNDNLFGDENNDVISGEVGNDQIWGGTGDDRIDGNQDADTIYGDAGVDIIHGNAGTDTIYGGADGDFLYGDEDNDVIMGDGGNDHIDGNAGNDTLLGDSGELNGTNYVSTSTTDAGNDTIHGNTGEDKILGGAGADSLHGDEETDAISGEAGDDTIYGGAGNDFLDGNDDNDVIMGDGGNDTINGNAGNDTLLGDSGELNGTNYVSISTTDAGNDTVHGNTGDDTILGGAGDDLLHGDADSDTISGETGDDTIYGGAANDFLYGNEDNDVIMGDGGNDTIDGNAGNDTLLGDSGELNGTNYVSTSTTDAGNDTIHGNTGEDKILGGAGADSLHGDEETDAISGEAGDDTIYGGAGNDFLDGNEDDDVVMGDGGNDTINGNAGNDTLLGDSGELNGTNYVSTVTPDAGNDTVHGNTGDDTILGGAGNDNLFGDENNDVISGEVGNDQIWGGTGDDRIDGNQDADTIYGDAGVDIIHGNTGTDTIYGGADGDFLYGDEDNDVIMGDGGNDTIDGNAGDDTLLGDSGELAGTDYVSTSTTDAGDDTVHGNAGDDTILGGAGNDLLHGDADIDTVSGEAGDDTIYGGTENDKLYGGDDNDIIMGDGGDDLIDGNAGDDRLLGDVGQVIDGVYVTSSSTDAGNDTVHGHTGEDAILGGAGADDLYGDENNDTIFGEAGDDKIWGGADDDTIQGNEDDDVIHGDAGDDTIEGNEDDDQIFGDAGEDKIHGNAGDDLIHGNDDNDEIFGDAGNDEIYGQGGNDIIQGNAGDDIVYGDSGARTSFGLTSISTTVAGSDSLAGNDGNDILIGGSFADTISGGANEDTIVGDAADIHLTGGLTVSRVNSTVDPLGSMDIIQGDDGNDVAVGGDANDLILGNAGSDVLIGDHADILLSTGGYTRITSTEIGVGAIDVLQGGDDDDILVGGAAGDTLHSGDDAANDILIGDAATIVGADGTTDAMAIFTSVHSPVGGADTITAVAGKNIIVAGADRDLANGGTGQDWIVGDFGDIRRTATDLKSITSVHLDQGDVDTIDAANGNNIVIGGPAGDLITTGSDADQIIGDNGKIAVGAEATFGDLELRTILAVDVDTSGDTDTISTGDGADVVLAGSAADTVTTGSDSSQNVILGDNGFAYFDNSGTQLRQIESTDANDGGNDEITTSIGPDVVIAGSGDDDVDAGTGNAPDILVGDHGVAVFGTTGVLENIQSTDPSIGGNDELLAGDGDDIVIGGVGADYIHFDRDSKMAVGPNAGKDIILGDNGTAEFTAGVLTSIATNSPEFGGDDLINAGVDSDIVMGGSGADQIEAGSDTGEDVVLGDNGSAEFDNSNGSSLLRQIRTSDVAHGGIDNISTGNGYDIVLGGSDGDTLNTGGTDSSRDIVLGDNGELTFAADGVLTTADSSTTGVGGDDSISTILGADLVIGGPGNDTVDTGTDVGGDVDRDVVVGDDGLLRFTDGVLLEVSTTNPTVGGSDNIITGGGDDVVIAGPANDEINGESGGDVLLGDNGFAKFDSIDGESVLREAQSTDTQIGGDDSIKAGNGINVVLGGQAADAITGGNDVDYVLGDNGKALFDATGILRTLASTLFETTPADGGNDFITTGGDSDVVIAGPGNDIVGSGSEVAADIMLGDDGEVTFDASGIRSRIATTNPNDGGNDEIYSQAGADIVVGGPGRDRLVAGGDDVRDTSDDLVLGDLGVVTFDTVGDLSLISSTEETIGDNDKITVGGGNDIVIAGMADDIVLAGAGDDVVFGDSAELSYASGTWLRLTSTAQESGGFDQVLASFGNDIVVGGADGDVILGGENGDDIILGDNGLIVGNDGSAQANDIVSTGFTLGGGDDLIAVEDGWNKIIGGDGNDNIKGGSVRDWIAGDYADAIRDGSFAMQEFVSVDEAKGGMDGISGRGGFDVIIAGAMGDIASGHSGKDVVLGDNGRILTNGELIYHIRVTASEIGGADTLYGNEHDDIIMGGADADFIDGGISGDDLLVGDVAIANFSALFLKSVTSIDPHVGGEDQIFGGNGHDRIIGGLANDTIDAGTDSGADLVIGDHGHMRFDLVGNQGLLRDIRTTDPYYAGDDIISAGDGPDIVFGGTLADNIHGGSDASDDILVGDNGVAIFDAEQNLTDVITIDNNLGGNDILDALEGNDIVVGGRGFDTIDAGAGVGKDHILGDSGFLSYDSVDGSRVLRRIESATPQEGHDDTILAGDGEDVVIAGSGSDTVNGGVDDVQDVIIGDNGFVQFDTVGQLEQMQSASSAIGGADVIETLDGDNFIIGGSANDTITTGPGDDVILGDSGQIAADSGSFTNAVAVDFGIGGDDRVLSGHGNDFVMGGAADDWIESFDGDDVVLGDSGDVSFAAGEWLRITSIAQDIGGDDTILAGSDNDVVVGGFGGDTILAGFNGNDIVLGDNGLIVGADGSAQANDIITTGFIVGGGNDNIRDEDGINHLIGGDGNDNIRGGSQRDWIAGDHADAIRGDGFVMEEFISTADELGGIDGIAGRSGSDVIIAGTEGDIASGNSGNDFVLGDNGHVRSAGENILRVEPKSLEVGGADTLYGDSGNDVVIGGHDSDIIDGGVQGNDVLLGDNGIVIRADGSPQANDVLSTNFTLGGGDDRIKVADGLNIIIGGRGDDFLQGGIHRDYMIGDYGDVERDAGDVITKMDTSIPDPSLGGNDTLRSGLGDYNVAIGGNAADEISTSSGIDIALGDNGRVHFDSVAGNSVVRVVETTNPDIGDNDFIVTAGSNDYILGGASDDIIGSGTDVARDVVMGDHGKLTFNAIGEITRIESIDNTLGGNDSVWAADGSDLVIGGPFNDYISAGPSDTSDSHPDFVLGDNGIIIVRDSGVVALTETTSPAVGGNDEIITGGGNDFVAGGFGNDLVDAGSQNDVVLGDNGFANFDAAGNLTDTETTDPDMGGQDNITAGLGDDVVFGGFDNDTIRGNAGHDLLFGDNGKTSTVANDADPQSVDLAEVQHPTLGGDDLIFGDAGRDRIAGGTGNDTINGGTDHDVIFGDHAKFDSNLPANQNFEAIFTTDEDGGGQDFIHGDADDDFIVGGQDNDQIFGDGGDDDITGGHNVRFGADGDDYVEGGDDADVILGDNGTIHRTLIENEVDQWKKYPAPFADVIRTVARYDDIDRVAGNDTLIGDNASDVPGDAGGDDIVHGQRGNDTIAGRGGDDELLGELGDDTITGGDGHDTILADVGIIDREFIDADTPRVDRNGKWHRDIVLEEVGELTEVIDMDQTPLRVDDPNLAQKLLTTDLLVLSGGYDATASQHSNQDNGAWDTDVLLIDLNDSNNDTVDGGAGEDIIFGQRGDDTLSGGADDDHIFGDNAQNSVPYFTELPKIVHTYRLIGDSTAGIIIEEAGSVIVAPVVQLPEEMELNNPYRLPDLHSTVIGQRAADIAGAGTLQRQDGTYTLPFAAVIADVAHHTDVLAGNDTIAGDAGDDFIVADDAHVSTPLLTGFQPVDDAANRAHLAFARAVHTLGTLSSDYATLNGATDGVPYDIEVGNDIVDGGEGDDKLIGDNGLIIADFILGLPTDANDYIPSAIDLQAYFGDLTHLATDFEFMTFAAHHAVLEDLAGVGTTTTTNPDVHDFQIGNDTITDDAGANHVTGDHAVILTPTVNGQRFSLIVQETAPIDPAAQSAAVTLLSTNLAQQMQTLDEHIAMRHDVSGLTLTATQLAMLPPDFEFDVSIGNDTINTQGGDDLVVGDFGAYSFPILLETPVTQLEQVDVELKVKILAADMARWLERRHHDFNYVELSTGYSHVTFGERGGAASEATMLAGNDEINTGTGADFVLGDSVSVSTSMLFLSPDTRFAERDPEFKVAFLNRRNFELTDHFSRIGNGSLFGQDTIDGGSENDTLFGQTYNDGLLGGDGDDVVHGGTGVNTADGGSGVNDVRPGSNDRPADLLLDHLETYQFDTLSPTTLDLIDDVGNEPEIDNDLLTFDLRLGNFRFS